MDEETNNKIAKFQGQEIEDEPESELRDRDPRAHVTKAMTRGKIDILPEVSEVPSAEVLRYFVNQDVDGQIMSPLFHIPQYAMLSHLISKDRKSRQEYTDILSKSYYHDQMMGVLSSGPQILRKAIKGQQQQEGPDE